MKQVIFILLFVFANLTIFTQNVKDEHNRKYSRNELVEDYELLIKVLKEGHPGIYQYVDVDSLNFYVEQNKKLLVDSLTESEFHLIVRNLITHIGCGHTTALPSTDYYVKLRANLKMLPFEVFVDGDKIFVSQDLSTELDILHKEILSIDNIPAKDILSRMREIQQRDGYTDSYLNSSIENLFRTYFVFIYGQKKHNEIVYNDFDDMQKIVNLASTDSVAPSENFILDPAEYEKRFESASITLSYSLKHTKLAILKIRQFESKKYNSTYKDIFKSLKRDGIKYLVLDLRDNSGGYFLNANALMTYLLEDKFEFVFNRPRKSKYDKEYITTDFFSMMTISMFKTKPDFKDVEGLRTYAFKYKPKKKNSFGGEIFVLTNGGTFSMSSCTSAYLSQLDKVTIIGSETGGGYDGSNAIINSRLEMPNTKVRVVLPNFHLIHQVPKQEVGKGVIPDIETGYTIQDRFTKKDLEMEKVLVLIGDNK